MDQLFIDSYPPINVEEGEVMPKMKGVGDEEVQPKSGFNVLRTNICPIIFLFIHSIR